MHRARALRNFWVLCLTLSAGPALADGKVVPEVFYPKVEIPNQQALIHFSKGVEHLVIETSFLGQGTNFAWVVPLPSAPEVKRVSEDFFRGLRQAFQPRLIHQVHLYYAGVLFVCGLIFLGARSLRDERSWFVDLPLCVLLATGAGLLGRHYVFGLLAAALALYIRLFARSTAAVALVLLIGMVFATGLVLVPKSPWLGLVDTMDRADSADEVARVAGVTVVSVQHAGVFDSTTIRGANSGAVLEWFERNGYLTPKPAERAIQYYLDQGWVFVASKVRRKPADSHIDALHPLAFTFATGAAVYPTRLTAVDNGSCAIDLYVFGNKRAVARHFNVVRCDRVFTNPPALKNTLPRGLQISDPEFVNLIGNSTVGTKLSGRLSPAQMTSDVQIKSSFLGKKSANVYSHTGALTISLNVALPLAALTWLLLGASRGAWAVNEKWISRWRWRALAAAISVGLAVFLLMPKVEIERVSYPLTSQE